MNIPLRVSERTIDKLCEKGTAPTDPFGYARHTTAGKTAHPCRRGLRGRGCGLVAEWPNAPVLKIGDAKASGGSIPSQSAWRQVYKANGWRAFDPFPATPVSSCAGTLKEDYTPPFMWAISSVGHEQRPYKPCFILGSSPRWPTKDSLHSHMPSGGIRLCLEGIESMPDWRKGNVKHL